MRTAGLLEVQSATSNDIVESHDFLINLHIKKGLINKLTDKLLIIACLYISSLCKEKKSASPKQEKDCQMNTCVCVQNTKLSTLKLGNNIVCVTLILPTCTILPTPALHESQILWKTCMQSCS